MQLKRKVNVGLKKAFWYVSLLIAFVFLIIGFLLGDLVISLVALGIGIAVEKLGDDLLFHKINQKIRQRRRQAQ
jgi:uncharacterized membrane protein